MDEFNELKIAFSRKHLKVAAWCMDGSRAKYTFKAHPQNQYFFDRNVIEDILQREGFKAAKCDDCCLEPIKNQVPKYLRLPYPIFNDIDLMLPIN